MSQALCIKKLKEFETAIFEILSIEVFNGSFVVLN